MQNGIVTVGLPTIGRDLQVSNSLILWYDLHKVSLILGPPPYILWHADVSSSSQANWPTSSVQEKSFSRDVYSTQLSH